MSDNTRELATILAAGRGVHERVREALETHVAAKLFPSKVVALAALGEPEWRWVRDVAQALPRFLDAPKVWNPEALALGIAEGVQQGTFGYAASASAAEDGSLSMASPSAIRLREQLAAEHIELGDGAVIMNVALAERLRTVAAGAPPTAASPTPPSGDSAASATSATADSSLVRPAGGEATGLRLTVTATEDDLFVVNQSLSKLRDLLSGGTMQLNLSVEARTANSAPLDRVRARNTVIEPLEEDPDIEVREEWLGES